MYGSLDESKETLWGYMDSREYDLGGGGSKDIPSASDPFLSGFQNVLTANTIIKTEGDDFKDNSSVTDRSLFTNINVLSQNAS